MIATSKISTQGLQINSSGGNNFQTASSQINRRFKRPTTKSNNPKNNISDYKSNDINKLDDLFKISLDFENTFLKNLDESYKSSIAILDDTYQNSMKDIDESYKSSVENLEYTYNISKQNLNKSYNKSKKILETNFEKAFTYLKKNFEIKQKLDKEREEQLREEKVIKDIYKPKQNKKDWTSIIKNSHINKIENNVSIEPMHTNQRLEWNNFTKQTTPQKEEKEEKNVNIYSELKKDQNSIIKQRKEQIIEFQRKIQEEKNRIKYQEEERIQNEKIQKEKNRIKRQQEEYNKIEQQQIEEKRNQLKKELAHRRLRQKYDIVKIIENKNIDPEDISDFFLNKKIDSEEYKYALNIYSGIGPTKTQLYKNNKPSISYSEDLEISQGYINWKNVEYITNSKFIMFVLYSNECKNNRLQTELIKKHFSGNIQVTNVKVIDVKCEYCKNPRVIINEQEIKFQYQIILKFKVDKKIELNSNINISWLLEF